MSNYRISLYMLFKDTIYPNYDMFDPPEPRLGVAAIWVIKRELQRQLDEDISALYTGECPYSEMI